MPLNGINIGKDVTVNVVTSYGPMTLTGITGFHPKAVYTEQSSKGLDGVTRHLMIPDGWDITINIDRSTGDVDTFFAQVEADYFAGIPVQAATILETIQETDGSVSQYRYDGLTLKYDDPGNREGQSLIKIVISGKGSRRVKVA